MKEIYDWVPWFEELAGKIKDGGEQYLIDRAKQVEWRDDGKQQPLLSYSDESINPFSFFYSLASRKDKVSDRERLFPSIESAFDLKNQFPTDLDDAIIFPTAPAQNTLFHGKRDSDPQLLWRLYRAAVSGRESVNGSDFNEAQTIHKVGVAKLTQTLFLINPTEFFPVDKHATSLGVLPFSKQPKEISWDEYCDAIGLINRAFPGCELYEANLFSYLRSSGQLTINASGRFQVSTNAHNDGTDYWREDPAAFLPNNWVFTGGPRSKGGTEYPVSEPRRGDVVLVRFGRRNGRGIGIVYKNDYIDGYRDDGRLHVVWLNKSSAQLSSTTTITGFWEAKAGTYSAFRNTVVYKPTFDLLERLGEASTSRPPIETIRNDSLGATSHRLNTILYGPPGTSKTWNTVKHALAIIDGAPVGSDVDHMVFDDLVYQGRIKMVTFHQNYAYEDFVEGIRPKLKEDAGLEYELRDGIFKQLVEDAIRHREDRYVLIIDEINRGNIAKIFGELITLIEDSRRLGRSDPTKVTLPYSRDQFAVPDNLYIIGTMNTADRGIQLLDTALRRRFTFVEMMPDPEHELIADDVDSVDCRRMLKVMNDRITSLLDREHQIGHTYLFAVTDMQGLSKAFRNEIFPLLQEYFFDDWLKIRDVLGHNGFVTERNTEHLFRNTEQGEDYIIYERLPDTEQGWVDPESYRSIYEGKGVGNADADDA